MEGPVVLMTRKPAAGTILPYRFGNIVADDDLSDVVPIPGGVPITHAEHLWWARDNEDDIWQALVDTVTIYDRGREEFGKIDAEYVAALVREYGIVRKSAESNRAGELRTLHRDKAAVGVEDRHSDYARGEEIARELVAAGLKIGPISKLVSRNDLKGLSETLFALPLREWEAIDNACLRGENYQEVAKRYGISSTATLSWWNRRGWDMTEPREEAMHWYLMYTAEYGKGGRGGVQTPGVTKNVFDPMRRKYPYYDFKLETFSKRAGRIRSGNIPRPEPKDTWKKPW